MNTSDEIDRAASSLGCVQSRLTAATALSRLRRAVTTDPAVGERIAVLPRRSGAVLTADAASGGPDASDTVVTALREAISARAEQVRDRLAEHVVLNGADDNTWSGDSDTGRPPPGRKAGIAKAGTAHGSVLTDGVGAVYAPTVWYALSRPLVRSASTAATSSGGSR